MINVFEMTNDNMSTSQIEKWSILRDVTYSVQYHRNAIDCYKLDVRILELKIHKGIYVKIEEDYILQSMMKILS